MFIRKTLTGRGDGGERYATYRLVRSERIGGRVRQVTLLNLGADFGVPEEQWRELALLIETLLAGSEPLLEPDAALRPVAEDVVRRLHARDLGASRPGDESDLATVRLDSLSHEQVRSVGCERLALAALDDLRFIETLERLGASERDARIAAALVVARMIHPSSEREAFRWLSANSATLELLDVDSGKSLTLSKLYRIGDLLWRHRAALEEALCARERDLFGIPDTIVFFDLTNTHMTGRPSSALARFGRSKQRRDDCPIVTLALSLNQAGFPQHSEILPGNISEPATLADAIGRLECQARGSNAPRPTVIMDAGISTEANLAWLRAGGYHWITVRRGVSAPPGREADAAFETRAGHDARAWRLAAGDDEAHLCVWSHERQQKDEAVLARQRHNFEDALRALHGGLSKKNHIKQFTKVMEKLGRLKERYRRVHRQYDIEVESGEKGRASAVRWRRNALHAERDRQAGIYVLRTSHVEWDLETVVRTYWKLTELEATFRSLKSEIGLRPVWHSKTSRIAAHLFIAVLAYHAVHLLRTRLAAHGLHDRWSTIRDKLAGWVRLTSTIREVDGNRIVIRQDAQPDAEARVIAQAAGLTVDPHRRRAVLPGVSR